MRPIHLGYKNIVPRCIEVTKRQPIFEDLSEMYEFVNDVLIENPLEGSYRRKHFMGNDINHIYREIYSCP